MRRSERGPWIAAWAVSLLLHLVAILGFPRLPMPRERTAVRDTIPVQLLDLGEPSRRFTQLPRERADQAPAQADLLSDVTSRARDLVPGGDQEVPRLQGHAADADVGLAPRGASDGARRSVLRRPGLLSSPLLEPGIASAAPAPASSSAPSRAPGAPGNARSAQAEGGEAGGNVALSGDLSLNTTAWNYAPWIERFRDRLMDRWHAPEAYSLGILEEGGFGQFEVEISRSGKMLRLDQLATDGHPSLAAAARSALRSLTPIEPLPADFPESTLVIRIRMIYPEIKPR